MMIGLYASGFWLLAALGCLAGPAAAAENLRAEQPRAVRGLAYPNVTSARGGVPDFIQATSSCTNPAHAFLLDKGAQSYSRPELTDEVFGVGDDIDQSEKDRYAITGRKFKSGAERTAYKAIDRKTGKLVAIKKVTDLLREGRGTLHAYKVWAEVKMLKLAEESPDIMKLNRFIMGSNTAFLVLDILETDVPPGQHPRSADILTMEGAATLQQRVFQFVRGVAFFHAANMAHNDLRWYNVMLSEDCRVVIAELEDISPAQPWSRTTPLYMPMHNDGGTMVRDIWQAGATIMSWVVGKDAYKLASKYPAARVKAYVQSLGYPSPDTLAMYTGEVQNAFKAERLLGVEGMNIAETIPEVDDRLMDLVRVMLSLDRKVQSAVELLQHPYLKELHEAEPLVQGPGDVSRLFMEARLRVQATE